MHNVFKILFSLLLNLALNIIFQGNLWNFVCTDALHPGQKFSVISGLFLCSWVEAVLFTQLHLPQAW